MFSIASRTGLCAALAAACLLAGGAHPVLAQAKAPAAAEAPAPSAGDMIKKLRKGGYVIYIRHTQTDSNTKDGDLTNMSDCSKQRILSKEGQDNAAKLGAAFKAAKIPVGSVLTSRFCRAKETAKLMGFDKAKESADLDNDSGEPAVNKTESDRRGAALRKLLATAPSKRKNTVIIGHVPNIKAAAGLDFANMKEGEFAIFVRAKGDPGFESVGRVTQDALQKLAQTASK
jgi:phosphohistidine phosphatase SixA